MAHAPEPLDRATLNGLHKILAVECADQIRAFHTIKESTNGNPHASINEGNAVRECYHATASAMKKACGGQLFAYKECLQNEALRFERCRETENALRQCYFSTKE